MALSKILDGFSVASKTVFDCFTSGDIFGVLSRTYHVARNIGVRAYDSLSEIFKTIIGFVKTQVSGIYHHVIDQIFDIFSSNLRSISDFAEAKVHSLFGGIPQFACAFLACVCAFAAYQMSSGFLMKILLGIMTGVLLYARTLKVASIGVLTLVLWKIITPMPYYVRMDVGHTHYQGAPSDDCVSDFKTATTGLFGLGAMLLCCCVGLPLKNGEATFDAYIKRFVDVGRATSSFDEFTHRASTVLESCVKFVQKHILGNEYISTVCIPDVEFLCTRVIQLCALDNLLEVGRNVEISTEIAALYTDMLRYKKMYGANKIILEQLNTISAPLTQLFRIVSNKNPKALTMRKEPLCVVFSGTTGTGKSYLMAPLQQDLLKIAGKMPQSGDIAGLIYSRCQEQEFWDGYSGQSIIVYDDFGQQRDSQANPNLEFFELIRGVNIFPYNLHSAALNEKANNSCMADFIVLTTNITNFKVESIISIEALQRRMHLVYDVAVIPEVQMGLGIGSSRLRVDTDKLEEYRRKNNLGPFDKSHWIFRDVVDNRIQGEPKSYDQIVVEMSLRYEQLEKDFECRTAMAQDSAKTRLPAGAYSRDVKWQRAFPQAGVECAICYRPCNARYQLCPNGHRLHRNCYLRWKEVQEQPRLQGDGTTVVGLVTCPMCRSAYPEGGLREEDILDSLVWLFDPMPEIWLTSCQLKPPPIIKESDINCWQRVSRNGMRRPHFIQDCNYVDVHEAYFASRKAWSKLKPKNGRNMISVDVTGAHDLVTQVATIGEATLVFGGQSPVAHSTGKFQNTTYSDSVMSIDMQICSHGAAALYTDFMVKDGELKPITYPIPMLQEVVAPVNVNGYNNFGFTHFDWVPSQYDTPVHDEQKVWYQGDGLRYIPCSVFLNCTRELRRDIFTRGVLVYIGGTQPNEFPSSLSEALLFASEARENFAEVLPIYVVESFCKVESAHMPVGHKLESAYKMLSRALRQVFRKILSWNCVLKSILGVFAVFPLCVMAIRSLWDRYKDSGLLREVHDYVPESTRPMVNRMQARHKYEDSCDIESPRPGQQRMVPKARYESGRTTDGRTRRKNEYEGELSELFPSRAKPQGILSSQTEQLIPKLRQNIYEVVLEFGDRSICLGKCTAIRGHYALINYHYLQKIALVQRQSQQIFEYRVNFRQPEMAGGHGYTLEEFLSTMIRVERGNIPTEFFMFRLPKACPLSADIARKHMMTPVDLGKLQEGVPLSVITYEPRDNKLPVRCVRSGLYKGLMTIEIRDVCMTDKYHVYPHSAKYAISTREGDCGSPVVVDSDMFSHKIVGFHFAGNAGHGMCSIITSDDVEKLMDPNECESADVQMITPLSEEPPEFPMTDSSFRYLGTINPPVFGSTNTALRKSKIYGMVGEVTTAPAVLEKALTPGGPMLKGLMKNAASTITINKLMLAACVKSYETLLVRNIPEGIERKILTFEEACQGIVGNPYFPPLQRSKSAGWPLMQGAKRGKTEWLGDGEWDFSSESSYFLRQLVKKMEEECSHGVVPEVYFVDTLKDEKRPLAKVKEKKTRVFSAAPLAFTILFRKYFSGFLAHMMRTRIDNEAAIGINVHSAEWGQLAKHLQHCSGDNYVAGDLSNFDGTVHYYIFDEIIGIINRFYGDNDKNRLVRKMLWECITKSKHIVGNLVYQFSHGQPSGNPATAVTNSMYLSLAMRFVYMKCLGSCDDFNEKIRLIVYGDDNIISVHPSLHKEFNPVTIAQGFESIGMVYTSEDKTELTHQFRSFSDVSFLKRHFVQDEEFGWCFAPLDLESLIQSLHWIKKSVSDDKATIMNCEDVIQELYHHDEGDFYEFEYCIDDALRDVGLRRTPSYDWRTGRLMLIAGKIRFDDLPWT